MSYEKNIYKDFSQKVVKNSFSNLKILNEASNKNNNSSIDDFLNNATNLNADTNTSRTTIEKNSSHNSILSGLASNFSEEKKKKAESEVTNILNHKKGDKNTNIDDFLKAEPQTLSDDKKSNIIEEIKNNSASNNKNSTSDNQGNVTSDVIFEKQNNKITSLKDALSNGSSNSLSSFGQDVPFEGKKYISNNRNSLKSIISKGNHSIQNSSLASELSSSISRNEKIKIDKSKVNTNDIVVADDANFSMLFKGYEDNTPLKEEKLTDIYKRIATCQ